MNYEQLLSRINELESIANKTGNVPAHLIIRDIKADVITEINLAAAKKSGNLSTKRVMDKLLKEMRNSGREALAYAWIDSEGRQCFCNGFVAYRLYEGHHIATEDRPENVGRGVNLDQVYEEPIKYTNSVALDIKLMNAYKTAMKAAGAKRDKIIFKLGNDGCFYCHTPYVNVDYVIDSVNALGITELRYKDMINGMYGKSDIGDCIILPIRRSDIGSSALMLKTRIELQGDDYAIDIDGFNRLTKEFPAAV